MGFQAGDGYDKGIFHEVGAAGEPAFQADWEQRYDAEAGAEPLGYALGTDGWVVLTGRCRSTTETGPSLIFTLPVGFRPPAIMYFGVVEGLSSLKVVEVDSSGTVTARSGTFSTSLTFSVRWRLTN